MLKPPSTCTPNHVDLQGNNESKFAFYGHTHVAKHETINGVHVINPGSISQSRSNIEETYVELLIDDTRLEATLNFRNRNHEIISSENFVL